MLFARVVSEGLAHWSYVIGDGGEAAVIDPRRDVDEYLRIAEAAGARIRLVLETHRYEDLLLGSPELAERTGAEVWRADEPAEYSYGRSVPDGKMWPLGSLTLRALRTPGHTPGHTSYLLRSPDEAAWMLFCGDALFAGEVGRTDLAGKSRTREMTARLYDSLFGRILPLGDGVMLMPAHGGGSACGAAIDDRPYTTIGYERVHSAKLCDTARETFVARNAAESEALPVPPYFRRMEVLNVRPVPFPSREVAPMTAAAFREASRDAQVLDVRPVGAFGSAHVPGSLSVQADEIGAWAGWFLDYDRPLLLVTDDTAETREAVLELRRLGYDVSGVLAGGVMGWLKAGLRAGAIATRDVQAERARLEADGRTFVLDVRTPAEVESTGVVRGAVFIPLTALAARIAEVPHDRPVDVFCGTGVRSMMAASLMLQRGWADVSVVLGGMTAWTRAGFPTVAHGTAVTG